MQNAALYIRVSTDDQLEFSPDAQRHALLEYAKRNDMHVSHEHIFVDEGISGTTAKKRPAFQNMIATARSKSHPIDVILVHKFDRFARSREDSVVYKSLLKRECDIKVVSITEQLEDDKFSVILEAMLEAMAEYYSLNLSDEVKKGMTEKAKRGGFQASSPYGYNAKEKKGNLEIIEEEAKLVKLVFNKFVNDDMSYAEITNYINSLGYKTRKGNAFERRTIRYMLENPVYAGYTRWNYRNKKTSINPEDEWIIAKGIHQEIISKEIYDVAQQKIKQVAMIYADRPQPTNSYSHWLSGLLKCETCKGSMTFAGYTTKKKTADVSGYYACNRYKKGSCKTSNSLSVSKLEKYILTQLEADLDTFKKMELVPIVVRKKSDNIELDALKKQLDKIQKKYDMAQQAYFAEIDTIEEYKNNKLRIKQEEEDILSRLKKLEDETTSTETSNNFIQSLEECIPILKNRDIDIQTKNKSLSKVVQSITIDKTNDVFYIDYYLNE